MYKLDWGRQEAYQWSESLLRIAEPFQGVLKAHRKDHLSVSDTPVKRGFTLCLIFTSSSSDSASSFPASVSESFSSSSSESSPSSESSLSESSSSSSSSLGF